MTPQTPLPAGANAPLDGAVVEVAVSGNAIHGCAVIAEEGSAARVLTPADPSVVVAPGAGGAVVTFQLPRVAVTVERLRVVAWTTVHTRFAVPAAAAVKVDGAPRFTIDVPAASPLRAVELLQVYRRHGDWKVRSIASGWENGASAMATALKVPEAGLQPMAGAAAPDPTPVAGGHTGQSPPVGPPALRPIIDAIAGPGPREGDVDSIAFRLGGHPEVRLVVDPGDEVGTVTAVIELGAGHPRGTLAEAALRTSGAAPMGRIAFHGGRVYASASTMVGMEAVDTALAKALLAEAWSTGATFAENAGGAWSGDRLAPAPPRELRLGIAEDLGSPGAWAEIHEMLIAAGFLPLPDAPEACLLPEQGTMWLGPVQLAGMQRAWTVLCEAVLYSDVNLHGGAWEDLAALNTVAGPMRIGAVREVGLDAPWMVVLNFNTLQVQRGQPQRDLNIGLSMLESQAPDTRRSIRHAVRGLTDRNNLTWPPSRRWSGPGRAAAEDVLIRELAGLAAGAPPPGGLVERARARRGELGAVGLGYLAHLALQRAEAGGRGSPWIGPSRDLVALVPFNQPSEPLAAASLHVRLSRLTAPPPRSEQAPPAPPSPPDRQTTAAGSPTDPSPPRRRRRWFGG